MTRLALLADDLTGALDASAPFAMRGLSTVVALHTEALGEALASGAEIVGVSTNSRDMTPEAATAAVAAAITALPADVAIFKKVDSRLKGNIAAELDAIPYNRSLVIPAIPAFKRWMRHGHLGGFGIAEPISVRARLDGHALKATIPDAITQADIEAALASTDYDLLVGARSLAEALAKSWSDRPAAIPALAPTTATICAVGSTDPITLAQIADLREQGADLTYIAAPLGIAPADLPAMGLITLLQATPGDKAADPASVARNLALFLQRLDPAPGTKLVLSGGATAHAILDALGIGVVTLLGEALPGVPIAQGGGVTIVTKSGGFGDKTTLTRLLGPPSSLEPE